MILLTLDIYWLRKLYEEEKFDKILFMPANKLLIKEYFRVEDRLAMLRIVIEGNPNFEISDMEIKEEGFLYNRYIERHEA